MHSRKLLFSDILKQNKEKPKCSLYIGLNLHGGSISDLKIEGGENTEDYHVTLVWGLFNPRSDIDDTVCRIQDVMKLVPKLLPRSLAFFHEQRFEASESSDGKDVIVAKVAHHSLDQAHNVALELLKREHINLEMTFPDYVPHMTLAYIEPDTEYELRTFNKVGYIRDITVCIKDNVTHEKLYERVYEMKDNNDHFPNSSFYITKADADKRLVFGWALVSATKEGETIIDRQGDIVDQEDLEEGAYEYVLNFRDAGEEHIGTLRKKARMVESVVFTEEKLKAMGIPKGTVPIGWWIGFYVDDDTTWERIKDGTYQMFSIEGKAIREPVNEPVTKSVAKSFSEIIEKFNPYHDARGRFTTAGGGYASFSANPNTKAGQLAIQRASENNPLVGLAYGTDTKQSEKPKQNTGTQAIRITSEDGTTLDYRLHPSGQVTDMGGTEIKNTNGMSLDDLAARASKLGWNVETFDSKKLQQYDDDRKRQRAESNKFLDDAWYTAAPRPRKGMRGH